MVIFYVTDSVWLCQCQYPAINTFLDYYFFEIYVHVGDLDP